MKLFNELNWIPIYLDPTSEEITELGESKWDTVRILIVEKSWKTDKDNEHLCIASGYGHTHTSLVSALKAYYKVQRGLFTTPAILFFKQNVARFNLGDMCGPDDASFVRATQYFSSSQMDIFRAIIEARGLNIV